MIVLVVPGSGFPFLLRPMVGWLLRWFPSPARRIARQGDGNDVCVRFMRSSHHQQQQQDHHQRARGEREERVVGAAAAAARSLPRRLWERGGSRPPPSPRQAGSKTNNNTPSRMEAAAAQAASTRQADRGRSAFIVRDAPEGRFTDYPVWPRLHRLLRLGPRFTDYSVSEVTDYPHFGSAFHRLTGLARRRTDYPVWLGASPINPFRSPFHQLLR